MSSSAVAAHFESTGMAADAAMRSKVEAINTSGFTPYDTCCVILPDPVENTHKTASGFELMKTDQEIEKEKWAQTKATLIAVGDNAFMEWGAAANKPTPGDRVVVGRYTGATHKGMDGRDYTVCRDEDILSAWSGT